MKNLSIILFWAFFAAIIYVATIDQVPSFVSWSFKPDLSMEVVGAPDIEVPLTKTAAPRKDTAGGPIEYADPSKGGTFGPGASVTVLSQKGKISEGLIEDGKVTSPKLAIVDEEGQTELKYEQMEIPSLGRIELLSYPMAGYVIIRQNGKKIDVCLNYYEKEYEFYDYVTVVFKPQNASQNLESDLLC